MKYLKTAKWMAIVAAAVALSSESNPCSVSTVMAAETSPVVANTVLEWNISAQEDSNVRAVYDSTTKTLTIRGTGVSKDYGAASRPPWQSKDIEKVVIEDGVTKVGNNTIYMMNSVQQVSIGASVEELGKYVLAGCSGLTSLEIPGNVKKIGDFAFINCTKLESVTLEEGMQTLGNSIFKGCSALKSITIPQSMETMGNTVFGGCTALKTAVIGSGVTQVGSQPFNGCLALEEVTVDQANTHYMAEEGVLFNYTQTELIHYPGAKSAVSYEIPDSVASILKRAFADCSVLEDLTLSASVNKLYPSALIGSSIKNIYVKEENTTFSSIDGVLMNKEGNELLLYPLGRKETEYTIPESVEVIGSDSFYNCDVLTSVIMPKGLREIKSHAFSNCDGFTSFHLPDSVKKIGMSAFSFCNNLKAVNMGSNVTTIKSSAFKGRGSLKSIYVPSSVTSLEGVVFGEGTIIYGEEGSAIETYAQENSLVFRSIVPIEMDFGQVEVGKAVEAKTTSWVPDTGNTYSLIEPQFHYQISMAGEPDVENGEVILSVQPKEGWTVGNYQETIVVINEEGIVHTVVKAVAEAVSPATVYTITFEAGEGSVEVEQAQTEADGSLKELPQAEWEGYELEGWYTQEEGGEQVTESTVFTSSTTIYARWKKVEEPGGDAQEKVYTITFEAGEGSAAITEAQTEADGSLKELPQAEREGYELEGWYTQEEGGEQVTESTVFTSSTTIYARWKKVEEPGGDTQEKVYTITFEAGEGSVAITEAQTEADGSLKELPQAEREGYELEGWYTQEEGGEQVTVNTVFTEPTTIYARWKKLEEPGGEVEEKIYTITFEAGEGSVAITEVQTQADGKLKELPQAEWEGYELEGWYTQEEGGEQVTENTVFTSSTTIYARWKKLEEPGGDTQEKVYTITFEAGEGSVAVKEAQTEADGSLKELPQAEREGYELEGWYTQEEGGEQVTESTVFTSSTTIYARWKKVEEPGGDTQEKVYTITFEAGEGSVAVKEAQTEADGSLKELPQAEREGYELEGWYTQAEGGEQVTESTIFTSSTTIYARWKKVEEPGGDTQEKVYTITFEAGEGSVAVKEAQTQADGKLKELPQAKREGYELEGWYTKAKGGEQVTKNTIFTGATTIYARWKKLDNEGGNTSEKEWPFIDVEKKPGHWKYDNVKFVYERNLMGGVGGSNLFQPDRPLSRAMFATVLYRMAGNPNITYSPKFTDVKEGIWYSNAILWVESRKIAEGYTDGSYGIDDDITREQIAKMLYLYGKDRGYDVGSRASLKEFTDAKEVNGWAIEFMQWAVDAEMITGKPNDTAGSSFRLDPKGKATRAECAKMLTMFLKKYEVAQKK